MNDSLQPPTIDAPIALTIDGHNGVPINVWDYGGDGPNLVLCHCTGTHARMWDPIVKLLNGAFRILAPDTRGHGDSGKPEDHDAYDWKNMGKDLQIVMEQLELGSDTFAAGHSAGATQITYCQFQHPGTFSRAVLIDPIIGPRGLTSSPSAMGNVARRRRSEFSSKSDALANYTSKPPLNSWVPECVEAYVNFGFEDTAKGTAVLKCAPDIEGAFYDRGGAPDLFERLAEVSFEKIAHVTASESNVKAMIELQRPALASAEYIEIEGASHFIPQERPEEVAEILRATFA